MQAFTALCSVFLLGLVAHAADVLFISSLTGAELSLVQNLPLTIEVINPSQ